jgi:hypothetical protein
MRTSVSERALEVPVKEPAVSLEWLDLRALTEYASVSEKTLRAWIHRVVDPLPACQVEKKIFVRRSAFDRWLEKHAVQSVDMDEIGDAVDEILAGLGGKN